jgi:hypothetical protein
VARYVYDYEDEFMGICKFSIIDTLNASRPPFKFLKITVRSKDKAFGEAQAKKMVDALNAYKKPKKMVRPKGD